MSIRMFHVDAFTDRPFAGNPAAVCPLDKWLDDATLQAIAAEHNLSETAFFVPENGAFRLRWFTPAVEVDLCGHATLATAFVLFNHLNHADDSVRFNTASGELVVNRRDTLFEMDFPSRPPETCAVHKDLASALGAAPKEILAARDYFCVFGSQEEVAALTPDFERLKGVDRFAVIVTAPGRDCDFVSRFFAPVQGINEDPVTGSAHCTLIPYWSQRLGKQQLFGRQISKRGGEIWGTNNGIRVKIAGNAVLYAEGEIYC